MSIRHCYSFYIFPAGNVINIRIWRSEWWPSWCPDLIFTCKFKIQDTNQVPFNSFFCGIKCTTTTNSTLVCLNFNTVLDMMIKLFINLHVYTQLLVFHPILIYLHLLLHLCVLSELECLLSSSLWPSYVFDYCFCICLFTPTSQGRWPPSGDQLCPRCLPTGEIFLALSHVWRILLVFTKLS